MYSRLSNNYAANLIHFWNYIQEGVIQQKGQKIRMSQIFLNFSRTSENHTTKIRRSQGPDVSYFNLPEHE